MQEKYKEKQLNFGMNFIPVERNDLIIFF